MSFKRMLSLVLVLCMVLSFFPASAFADNDVVEGEVVEEVVEEPAAEEQPEENNENPPEAAPEEGTGETEEPASSEEEAAAPVVKEAVEEEEEEEEVVEEEVVEEVVEGTQTFSEVATNTVDPDDVAKIGTIGFKSLESALLSAAWGPITMLKDVSESVTISDGEVTLVGDGHTIGNVTVSGGTVSITGAIVNNVVATGGSLSISGGKVYTVTMSNTAEVALNTVMNDAAQAITVNGGTLSITGGTYTWVIGSVAGNVTAGTFGRVSKVLLADGYVTSDYASENNYGTGKVSEGNFVAMSGTGAERKYYTTFADAINANHGDEAAVIKLLANVTDGVLTLENSPVKINANSKTLTLNPEADKIWLFVDSEEEEGFTKYTTKYYAARITEGTDAGWYKTFKSAAEKAVETDQVVTIASAATLAEEDVFEMSDSTKALKVNKNSHDDVQVKSAKEGYFVFESTDPLTNVTTYELKATVAKIGDKSFPSLRAAVEAAVDEDTITLVDDDEVSFKANALEIVINKKITIDGGGHKVKGVADGYLNNEDHDIFISGEKPVTIKNVILDGFGANQENFDRTCPIWTGQAYSGELTLDNVTIRNYSRTAVNLNGGNYVIKDCFIYGDPDAYFQQGVAIMNAKGTITGTTITGTHGTGGAWDAASVQLGQVTKNSEGSVTLGEGNSFTGEPSLFTASGNSAGTGVNSGTLTIVGGTYNGDVIIDGVNGGSVVITGGTINGKLDIDDDGNATASFDVTGGLFSEPVPEPFCHQENPHYIPYQIDENTYGVKEGEFVARVIKKGESATTGGRGYEYDAEVGIAPAVEAAIEGFDEDLVLVILSGNQTGNVPATSSLNVYVRGTATFKPTTEVTANLTCVPKDGGTPVADDNVIVNANKRVEVTAVPYKAVVTLNGVPTYYETIGGAAAAAVENAGTIKLLTQSSSYQLAEGKSITVDQSGDYKLTVNAAEGNFIDQKTNEDNSITYTAKKLVASYNDETGEVKTDSFNEAAAGAIANQGEAPAATVYLYATPTDANAYEMVPGKLDVVAQKDGLEVSVQLVTPAGEENTMRYDQMTGSAKTTVRFTVSAAVASIEYGSPVGVKYFFNDADTFDNDATLTKAVEEANAHKNLVIKLLEDAELTIPVGFSITVDKNGKELTPKAGAGDAGTHYAIKQTPNPDGTVTVACVQAVADVQPYVMNEYHEKVLDPNQTTYYAVFAEAADAALALELGGLVTLDHDVPAEQLPYELAAGKDLEVFANVYNVLATNTDIKAKVEEAQVISETREIESKVVTVYSVASVAAYTFNFEGAKVVYKNTTYTDQLQIEGIVGSNVIQTRNTPVKPGYTFMNWLGSDNQKYTFKGNEEEGILPLPTTMLEGGMTFTAEWEAIDYPITYSFNVTGEIVNPNVDTHATYNIEMDPFTLADASLVGYDFLGWVYDGSPATDAVKDLEIDTKQAQALTVWGIFEQKVVTVTYAAGEGITGVTFDPEKNDIFYGLEVGAAPTVTGNPGYSVAGWKTEDGTEFKFGGTGVGTPVTEDVVVYPIWAVNPHTITYLNDPALAEGETIVNDNPETYDATLTENIVLVAPSRTGYNFVGWKLNGTGEPQDSFTIQPTDDADYSFTAVWTKEKKTVTYSAGEGVTDASFTPASVTVDYNSTVEAKPADHRTGYSVEGYYTTADFQEGTKFVFGVNGTHVTEDMVLYANWVADEFYITLNLNGGTLPVNQVNPIPYTIESESFKLPEATKDGYLFMGWTLDQADLKNAGEVTIEKGTYGNKTYVANWAQAYMVNNSGNNVYYETVTAAADVAVDVQPVSPVIYLVAQPTSAFTFKDAWDGRTVRINKGEFSLEVKPQTEGTWFVHEAKEDDDIFVYTLTHPIAYIDTVTQVPDPASEYGTKEVHTVVYYDNFAEAIADAGNSKTIVLTGFFAEVKPTYELKIGERVTIDKTAYPDFAARVNITAPAGKDVLETPVLGTENTFIYTLDDSVALVKASAADTEGTSYKSFGEAFDNTKAGARFVELLAEPGDTYVYAMKEDSDFVVVNDNFAFSAENVKAPDGYVLKTQLNSGYTEYYLVSAVAQVGDEYFETFAEAAAVAGDTSVISVLKSELDTFYTLEKDSSITVKPLACTIDELLNDPNRFGIRPGTGCYIDVTDAGEGTYVLNAYEAVASITDGGVTTYYASFAEAADAAFAATDAEAKTVTLIVKPAADDVYEMENGFLKVYPNGVITVEADLSKLVAVDDGKYFSVVPDTGTGVYTYEVADYVAEIDNAQGTTLFKFTSLSEAFAKQKENTNYVVTLLANADYVFTSANFQKANPYDWTVSVDPNGFEFDWTTNAGEIIGGDNHFVVYPNEEGEVFTYRAANAVAKIVTITLDPNYQPVRNVEYFETFDEAYAASNNGEKTIVLVDALPNGYSFKLETGKTVTVDKQADPGDLTKDRFEFTVRNQIVADEGFNIIETAVADQAHVYKYELDHKVALVKATAADVTGDAYAGFDDAFKAALTGKKFVQFLADPSSVDFTIPAPPAGAANYFFDVLDDENYKLSDGQIKAPANYALKTESLSDAGVVYATKYSLLEAVAEVDGTYYATFDEAVEAAGETSVISILKPNTGHGEYSLPLAEGTSILVKPTLEAYGIDFYLVPSAIHPAIEGNFILKEEVGGGAYRLSSQKIVARIDDTNYASFKAAAAEAFAAEPTAPTKTVTLVTKPAAEDTFAMSNGKLKVNPAEVGITWAEFNALVTYDEGKYFSISDTNGPATALNPNMEYTFEVADAVATICNAKDEPMFYFKDLDSAFAKQKENDHYVVKLLADVTDYVFKKTQFVKDAEAWVIVLDKNSKNFTFKTEATVLDPFVVEEYPLDGTYAYVAVDAVAMVTVNGYDDEFKPTTEVSFYKNLAGAVEAAKGENLITLLKDLPAADQVYTLTGDETLIINANGHDFTVQAAPEYDLVTKQLPAINAVMYSQISKANILRVERNDANPVYFEALTDAVAYVNEPGHEKLRITLMADLTETLDESYVGKPFMINDSEEFTATLQARDASTTAGVVSAGWEVVATPADDGGYTTYELKEAVAYVNYDTGEIDENYNPIYANAFFAELADASDFAHGELTIVLLKANVPYAIGEKSADEVLIVDENNKTFKPTAVGAYVVKEELLPGNLHQYSLTPAAASITVEGKTTYYTTFAEAADYAQSPERNVAKNYVVKLLANVEDNYTINGEKYLFVEEGTFTVSIVSAPEYVLVEPTEVEGVTEYHTVGATAYIINGELKTYYGSFAEAAEAAYVPTGTEPEKTIVLMKNPPATDKFIVVEPGSMLIDIRETGAVIVSNNLDLPEETKATPTLVEGTLYQVTVTGPVASIDFNGNVEYYYSIEEALADLAALQPAERENLFITPRANITEKVSETYKDLAFKVEDSDFTVELSALNNGYAMKAEEGEGYTTYTLVDAECYVWVDTGVLDQFNRPVYAPKYFAEVAEGIAEAAQYEYDITKQLGLVYLLKNDLSYVLGKEDVSEVIHVKPDYAGDFVFTVTSSDEGYEVVGELDRVNNVYTYALAELSTITFDPNGGEFRDGTTEPLTQTGIVGADFEIPYTDPTLDGSTFLYWLGDDGVRYGKVADEDLQIVVLDKYPEEDLNLTATYGKNYSYVYWMNVDEPIESWPNAGHPADTLYAGAPAEAPSVEGLQPREGYRLDEENPWVFGDEPFDGTLAESDKAFLTYHVNWIPTFTVTYEAYTWTKEYVVDEGTVLADNPEFIPENPQMLDYVFGGWMLGDELYDMSKPVTGDLKLTAKWVKGYSVSYVDENGDLLQYFATSEGAETPEYTGRIPTKESTAQYTYTFSGWDPEVAEYVTGNAVYTAVYDATVNEYTITWKDDNDEVIDTTTVAYGETPTHADAVKEPTAEKTYKFDGWKPAIEMVTGEATYTATFTESARLYTATFITEDGVTEALLPYGSTIGEVVAAGPTVISDNFDGWVDEDGVKTTDYEKVHPGWTLTGPMTLTATYFTVYEVTFDAAGGEPQPKAQTVKEGEKAVKPNDPTKDNSIFLGWFEEGSETAFDFENTPITGNKTLKAKWQLYVTAQSYSIALAGKIGVSFYVVIPEELIAAGITPEVFSEGLDVEVESFTPVTRAGFPANTYEVTTSVYAKHDQRQVTLRFFLGNELVPMYNGNQERMEGDAYVHSVYDYLMAIKDMGGKLGDLGRAMRNYCESVRKYFNIDSEIPYDITEVQPDAQALAPYKAVIPQNLPDGLSYYAIALAVQSDTKLQVYFQVASGHNIGEYTFMIDGSQVVPVQQGNFYYIESAPISAKDLDTVKDISVNGVAFSNVSALSYATNVINSTTTDASLKQVAMTIYNYNQAANAYFGA